MTCFAALGQNRRFKLLVEDTRLRPELGSARQPLVQIEIERFVRIDVRINE